MKLFAWKQLGMALLVLGVSTQVFATYVDDIVSITGTSSSGKTVLVDRGSAHDFVTDDYGIMLVYQEYEDPDSKEIRKVFKPVAKLKLVKLFRDSSIWISLRTYLPNFLAKGNKVILLSESRLLNGRTDFKIKRSKVIGHKENLIETVKSNLKEDGVNLSKKVDQYHVESNLHSKEKHYEHDLELIDVEVWEDRAGRGKYAPTAIFKSPHADHFMEKKRVATFEKMVYEFMRKYNDPKFTLKRFYFNQEKSEDAGGLNSKGVTGSAFDRYAFDEARRLHKDRQLAKDLESKGEVWSDGYSDEELSELLYNVSAVSEIDRRQEITSYHFNYQLTFSSGLNLVNNEHGGDTNNTSSAAYDFELAAEGFFFKNIQMLNDFTLELSLRRSFDNIDVGVKTANLRENSVSAHINWYPFHSPNTLERNILYLGLMTRVGFSFMEIPDTKEEGSYATGTIVGLKGGMRYNFKNSYGVRLALGLENIQLERIETNNDGGNLPDRTNFIESKLSVGLSKFF